MSTILAILADSRLTIGVSLVAASLFVYITKKFYFNGGSCTSRARLDGKTCIVTGSNTGIGKETCLDFAKRGARVILACRDLDRANKAAADIRQESGNGNVSVELVDLASLESIRQFCARINQNEERVDILVNNAAVMASPRWLTKDGFEMQFGVNHLGHFLLTNLLLDKLKASAPSRIVNVSALAYEYGCKDKSLKLDDLNSERSYEPWQVYQQSKMCNILFTLSLADKLVNTGVTVNALHPGIIRTELTRYYAEAYKWSAIGFAIFNFLTYPLRLWFLKSASQGAQTTIYCSVDEKLTNVSGKYFSDCKQRPLMPEILNKEKADRLWQLSSEFVKL